MITIADAAATIAILQKPFPHTRFGECGNALISITVTRCPEETRSVAFEGINTYFSKIDVAKPDLRPNEWNVSSASAQYFEFSIGISCSMLHIWKPFATNLMANGSAMHRTRGSRLPDVSGPERLEGIKGFTPADAAARQCREG